MPGSSPSPESPPRRRVVVTGGAKGIGREVVARFAALGDEVVALGRDEEALSALAAETGARAIACDVTDEAAVAAAFEQIGAVDVLVNNAGVSESAPLHRTTLASWNHHLAVNATGAFLCTRAVIAGMRERDRGAIVTVASTAARSGAPYIAAYAASKHAVLGLMRVTAAEVAGTGVTANAVCPAFVDTPMTRRSVARITERTGRSEAEGLAALAELAPIGRLLTPAEVAAAVVWLASPEAAAVNGQAIVLDGGGLQA